VTLHNYIPKVLCSYLGQVIVNWTAGLRSLFQHLRVENDNEPKKT